MLLLATDLIHDSCWGMGSVKVQGVTAGSHNTTKVCQKKKSTYLNVHTPTWASTDPPSHASWRLWGLLSLRQSGEPTCQDTLYDDSMPVCHHALSTNKQRRAGGAEPGRYGCATGLMSIVHEFVSAQRQGSHKHRRHPSQKGSLGMEEISSNCSWKMPPLEPSLEMQ